jgi:hypothetical protein
MKWAIRILDWLRLTNPAFCDKYGCDIRERKRTVRRRSRRRNVVCEDFVQVLQVCSHCGCEDINKRKEKLLESWYSVSMPCQMWSLIDKQGWVEV